LLKKRAPKRGGASAGGPDTPGTPKVKTQIGRVSWRRRHSELPSEGVVRVEDPRETAEAAEHAMRDGR